MTHSRLYIYIYFYEISRARVKRIYLYQYKYARGELLESKFPSFPERNKDRKRKLYRFGLTHSHVYLRNFDKRVYRANGVSAQNDFVFHQLVAPIQQLSPADTAHQGKRYARGWMLSWMALRSARWIPVIVPDQAALGNSTSRPPNCPVCPKSRLVDGRRTVCVELAGHLST